MDDREVAGEALERQGRGHLQQVDQAGDVVEHEGAAPEGHTVGTDQRKRLLRREHDRL